MSRLYSSHARERQRKTEREYLTQDLRYGSIYSHGRQRRIGNLVLFWPVPNGSLI